MRRINIKHDSKIKTISFDTKQELQDYVWSNVPCHQFTFDYVADQVWDLNVGKSFNVDGYTFSIQSKARAGNQLVL